MVSSETLNEKLPIRAFSPLNVKANCLVTSSLLPWNFSKKGNHCISLRIEMQSSWYWELSNMLGSTLLVILAEGRALTLLYLCFAISTKKFQFVTWWCRSLNIQYDARLTVLWLWWEAKPNGYISLLWHSLLSILTVEVTGVKCQREITENDGEITNYTYFIAYSSLGTEEWLYRLYRCHHRSAGSVYAILGYDFRESSESFSYVGWWNHN